MHIRDIQKEIGEWGVKTFNHDERHLLAIEAHLQEELYELQCDTEDFLDEQDPRKRTTEFVAEECADIFILLCSVAHVAGIDLERAIHRKMEINRSRAWGEPNDDGVIHHTATGDSE